MPKSLFRSALAAIVFLVAGCTDWPKEAEAERDFKADYPRYQLLKCYSGEGNSDAIYYHFEYKDEAGKLKTMRVLYSKSPEREVWTRKRVDGQDFTNFPIVLPAKTN